MCGVSRSIGHIYVFFSGCEKNQTEIPDRAAKLAEKSIMLTSHVIYSRENFYENEGFLSDGPSYELVALL